MTAGLPSDVEQRLAGWLAASVDPSISSVTVTRLAGGHSSGAWRVDAAGDGPVQRLVLKAPELPSVVYRRDALREGRILDDLARIGVPVPAVPALDDGEVLGRPCFVMTFVEGRAVADSSAAGFHDDEWFRQAGPEQQRAAWDAFHDALATLHGADPGTVPDAPLGPEGLVDVIGYWRASLLDVVEARQAPRQLAILDWLGEHLPPGADEAPSVCMGDARIANCLLDGAEARALVDFEVAYAGNPAADVAYSLFFSESQRQSAAPPLPGIPTPEETWRRWSRATGRPAERRAYWTAFGAMVLAVTASRAMVQWGAGTPYVESTNPVVPRWEQAMEDAVQEARR